MARYVLGPKVWTTFEQFYDVWQHIEDYISLDECSAKVDEAVRYVKQIAVGKRCGYGWSGGKDSIALQVIMERAGIHRCVMCTNPEESPIFLQWVMENKPNGCEIHSNDNITKKFLLAHKDRIFPQKEASWWYKFVPWVGLKEFQQSHNLDILFLGRRTNDGNFSRRQYRLKDSTCLYVSPIMDWRHEDVLACVHYFKNDNMPALYSKPCKGMPEPIFWYLREGGWPEVKQLYPELLPGLAKWFPEARQYL